MAHFKACGTNECANPYLCPLMGSGLAETPDGHEKIQGKGPNTLAVKSTSQATRNPKDSRTMVKDTDGLFITYQSHHLVRNHRLSGWPVKLACTSTERRPASVANKANSEGSA